MKGGPPVAVATAFISISTECWGDIHNIYILGGSGWAYGKGPAILYTLTVNAFMGISLYWLHPIIWKYAKDNNVRSISDFFALKYKSSSLGMLISIFSIAAMVPIFILQLKGLGIIVSQASYGSISSNMAIWIGVISVSVL